MAKSETIVTARAKAFSSEGVGEYKFLVDHEDGSVRVYNHLQPGTYTLVHSLSESAIRRIRKMAEAKRDA